MARYFSCFVALHQVLRCFVRLQGCQTCMLFEVFCEGSQRSLARLEAGLRVLEGLAWAFLVVEGMSINIKQLAKPILIQHFDQRNMERAKILPRYIHIA